MMKRLTWFLGGAAAGIAGLGLAKRKVKEVSADLAPMQVAKKAGTRVREAIADGKRAMKAKEAEMRARMDGSVSTLADDLEAGDAVFVDGEPVEPGKVSVRRQVREERGAGGRRRRA